MKQEPREKQLEEIVRENLRRYGHLAMCHFNGYGDYKKKDELSCTCWVGKAQQLLGLGVNEWPQSKPSRPKS